MGTNPCGVTERARTRETKEEREAFQDTWQRVFGDKNEKKEENTEKNVKDNKSDE